MNIFAITHIMLPDVMKIPRHESYSVQGQYFYVLAFKINLFSFWICV